MIPPPQTSDFTPTDARAAVLAANWGCASALRRDAAVEAATAAQPVARSINYLEVRTARRVQFNQPLSPHRHGWNLRCRRSRWQRSFIGREPFLASFKMRFGSVDTSPDDWPEKRQRSESCVTSDSCDCSTYCNQRPRVQDSEPSILMTVLNQRMYPKIFPLPH